MPEDGWYLTLADRSLVPYHTKTYTLPRAAQVPAGTSSCMLANKASVGCCFALFTPWLEAPFGRRAASFRHRQHRAPFRPPSGRVPETSLSEPTHHRAHSSVCFTHRRWGEHVAHWRLMNPPPRMDITLSCPQPRKIMRVPLVRPIHRDTRLLCLAGRPEGRWG